MFSTDERIEICVSAIHSKKAKFPIEVTCDGVSNNTSINDEHPLKAEFPIEVTDDGIIICFNFEHPRKA